MASSTAILHVRGLGKQKIAALSQQAKHLGMTPERYVKQLIEQELAIQERARTTTIDELMAPVRAEFERSGMAEEELDELVNEARSRHHKRISKGGRKR